MMHKLRDSHVLTLDDLSHSLREVVAACGYDRDREVWATAIRDDVLHNTTLLWGDESSGYRFVPPPMQDFLSASALGRAVNEADWSYTLQLEGRSLSIRQLVDYKAWDPGWQNVICMFAGCLNDPTALLQMLANAEPSPTNPRGDDVFRHRLSLAGQCVADLPAQLREPCRDLIDGIAADIVREWCVHVNRSSTKVASELAQALACLVTARANVKGVSLQNWIKQRLASRHPAKRREGLETIMHVGAPAGTDEIVSLLVHMLRSNTSGDLAERAILSLGPLNTCRQDQDRCLRHAPRS